MRTLILFLATLFTPLAFAQSTVTATVNAGGVTYTGTLQAVPASSSSSSGSGSSSSSGGSVPVPVATLAKAVVSPVNVPAGGKVAITVSLTAAAAALPAGGLIDIEVHGPAASTVAGATQFPLTALVNTGGSSYSAPTWTWTVPAGAAPGSYSVQVGIFTAGWASNPYWTAGAGALTVTAPTASSGSSSSGAPSSSGSLGIKVAGKSLVTLAGAVVQLRGVNVSGLEGGAVHGSAHPWDDSNLTTASGADPDFSKIAAWKANAVRLPLNEASWLGLTVTYANGTTRNADPSHDYQATVLRTVKEANAQGLYVILDLHWAAPGSFAPVTQNPFLDADHSLAFWSSVASAFKNNPAVLFELFNEPYLHTPDASDGVFAATPNPNLEIKAGGLTASYYMTLSSVLTGNQVKVSYSWQIAGYQAALDAVRATGATNVVIMGGQGYDNDETWWSSNPPSDPLKQLAMAMHCYYSGWGYDLTGSSRQFTAAQSIAVLAGPGVPVVLTEVGDQIGSATTGAGAAGAFITKVAAVADAQGWSVMAWTWNPWGGANTLIQNIATYAPTQGDGTAYQSWLISHK